MADLQVAALDRLSVRVSPCSCSGRSPKSTAYTHDEGHAPARGGDRPRPGTTVVAFDLAAVNALCASCSVPSTGLVLGGEGRSVDPVGRPDPHFRPYSLAPGWPITIEVHCTDGGSPSCTA
jgi:hypothetical protein